MEGLGIVEATNSGTLRSIQYLRGIAALMVTLHHTLAGIHGGVPIPLLHGGVDIFFVISGIIMWRVTAERAVSPLAFMRRRLVRVVPLYWSVTSLMVGVLLVPRAGSGDSVSAGESELPRSGEIDPQASRTFGRGESRASCCVMSDHLLIARFVKAPDAASVRRSHFDKPRA